jgi:alpha-L-arabinofuranosidase
MISRTSQPLLVKSEVQGAGRQLDVNAKRSEDGKTLVLQVVNLGDKPMPTAIHLDGFTPSKPTVFVEELAGPLNAVNTAEQPNRMTPKRSDWRHELANGTSRYTFAPHSFTVLRFE